MTYGELGDRSGRLADLLVERGVRRGDRVGLYLDKSLEAVVGIYGILRAGAAYVPFDPQAPLSRLAYIAGNADIRCLVSSKRKAASWPDARPRGRAGRDRRAARRRAMLQSGATGPRC